MEGLKSRIEQWLQPKLEEMNCYLVDVKVLNNGSKIEVYIDNNDNPVTISECEAVSRYLEFYLDNDGNINNKYVLDVSSPGMDNPFKVPKQYQKSIGRAVEILMNTGMKKEGILKYASDDKIEIEVHHPAKKKHLKPEITTEEIQFTEIKTVKKKIIFN
ncbi:MAG: ribosome assembly cofactor RimP [Fimbriimonadaceae bacterium]|nr:ribosome assembly cofactor RimP [Chitinophagales bacterium]